jgi:hypothetical protein
VVQCTTDNRLEGSGHSEAQNAALGGDSFISQWRAAGSKAISQLMVAIGPLGDPGQAMRAIDAFNTIWHAGLILFAVRLLLIGYLSYDYGIHCLVCVELAGAGRRGRAAPARVPLIDHVPLPKVAARPAGHP